MSSAAKQINVPGVEISPRPFGSDEGTPLTAGDAIVTSQHKILSFIEFDVAVTAVKKKGKEVGIGVVAGWFNLGGKRQNEAEHESVHIISFRVPVGFPGS